MKKKILFILHYPPPIHGAAMVGKFVKESRLINQSFECDYINLATSKNLLSGGKWSSKKTLTFFNLLADVFSSLRKKKHDLCYMTLNSQGPGFYKDLFIVAILKLFRQRIIYHFHNKGVSLHQNKKMQDLLYRFVFKDTHSILLSKYLYSDIKKYVKEENIFYCPNGIPVLPEAFQVNVLEKKPIQPFTILFLSNMMKEKGVWVLLEACKHLIEKGVRNFECHFVGDWYDVQEPDLVNRIQEYGLSGYVFSHGKKYNEEKNSYFRNADVFVFPSLNETFGLVNLEAMQFGLPIIATAEGGIPDVVVDGETGFLIGKEDAKALAEKIQFLYEQPDLCQKMGNKGRERFLEKFTLKIFEKNMKEILEIC